MSAFSAALATAGPPAGRWAGRRFVFVPYDQLSDRIGPLARGAPETLGILLVESPWKAARRPYHKQKLALVLANLRHFALEQARRGVAVAHVVHDGPYAEAVAAFVARHGPVRMMQAAERELRADLAPLAADGRIEVIPHEGWLTSPDEFAASHRSAPPWLLDTFYRHVRRARDVLMERGKPVGGKWSFDAENRKPWRGEPPAPEPPAFTPDAVTREVGALVERHFARHPGVVDLAHLPATRADAERMLRWAIDACLVHFGPYEDAMSTRSSGLFHTRLSPLMNLHRLLPREVMDAALAADLPLASREGFVRQILGWREFLHHVHDATDGFRAPLRGKRWPVRGAAGDGGHATWAGTPWSASSSSVASAEGGVDASALGARRPLPPAYWGRPSGLACLDHVVGDVWREAYSHHITRLMVLANLATLLDVSPRELTDWFWVAYQDAYDWVVEPNVLGMGTYGLGALFTTKPYVSGAAYIDRMSDYCGACAFDPKKNCPVTRLYWAFLDRHHAALRDNPRLMMPMRSVEKRDPAQKAEDARVFGRVSALLAAGERVDPGSIAA